MAEGLGKQVEELRGQLKARTKDLNTALSRAVSLAQQLEIVKRERGDFKRKAETLEKLCLALKEKHRAQLAAEHQASKEARESLIKDFETRITAFSDKIEAETKERIEKTEATFRDHEAMQSALERQLEATKELLEKEQEHAGLRQKALESRVEGLGRALSLEEERVRVLKGALEKTEKERDSVVKANEEIVALVRDTQGKMDKMGEDARRIGEVRVELAAERRLSKELKLALKSRAEEMAATQTIVAKATRQIESLQSLCRSLQKERDAANEKLKTWTGVVEKALHEEPKEEDKEEGTEGSVEEEGKGGVVEATKTTPTASTETDTEEKTETTEA